MKKIPILSVSAHAVIINVSEHQFGCWTWEPQSSSNGVQVGSSATAVQWPIIQTPFSYEVVRRNVGNATLRNVYTMRAIDEHLKHPAGEMFLVSACAAECLNGVQKSVLLSHRRRLGLLPLGLLSAELNLFPAALVFSSLGKSKIVCSTANR